MATKKATKKPAKKVVAKKPATKAAAVAVRNITGADLERLGACGTIVRVFNRNWPNGLPITQENVDKYIVKAGTVPGTGRNGTWLTQRIGMNAVRIFYAGDMHNVADPRKEKARVEAKKERAKLAAERKKANAALNAANKRVRAVWVKSDAIDRALTKKIEAVNKSLATARNKKSKVTVTPEVVVQHLDTELARRINNRYSNY